VPESYFRAAQHRLGLFLGYRPEFHRYSALDHRIAAQLHHDPRYRITQVVPYGIEVKPYGLGTCVIWQQPPR